MRTLLNVTNKLDTVRFVQIKLKDSEELTCLVHHEIEIARRSISSKQAQFRRTLASLQSDNPDLESLIATVEKIIFDEPFEIDPSAKKRNGIRSDSKESEKDQEIKTLAVELSETKKEKRRKRMLTSGDIGHLIDVLIHHLGIGLESEVEGTDKKGRTEEELVGADDDEDENKPELIDMPKMIKICNGKVRRLITRLEKKFKKTVEQKTQYDQCLMKLLAVLALLRELRALDYKLEGIPFGESLFHIKDRIRLITQSLKYLYGKDYRFLDNINNELTEAPWDELSRLNGLLLWLAHDCGADLREKADFNESFEDKKRRFFNKSYLLLITPNAVTDTVSLTEAKLSINRTTQNFKKSENLQWIDAHRLLGEKFYKLNEKAHIVHKKIKKSPRPGQIAFLREENNPTLHIVLRAGNHVILTDVSGIDSQRMYPAQKVAAVNFPKNWQ